MKIFIIKPEPNWITDRLKAEFSAHNPTYITTNPTEADILWSIGGGEEALGLQLLREKVFIKTIHHLCPPKLTPQKLIQIQQLDKLVNGYICPNHITCRILQDIIPDSIIKVIPYWSNPKQWKPNPHKDKIRQKYNIPLGRFVIGSFQRDTEGSDLISPKPEKGPDVFCDIVQEMSPAPHVVLTGWRRQYIQQRLKSAHIGYTYLELPSLSVIAELYNSLDLYLCTSRWEGGPQAILESSLCKIPILSTDCGMASKVLHKNLIKKNTLDFITDISRRKKWHLEYNQTQALSLALESLRFKYINYFSSWI